MSTSALWTYLGVVALITITPGPDTALVLRNATRWGPAAGIRTGIGSALGLLIWALAASAGIAVILTASAWAFTVLKSMGAAYLGYLGVKMLWSAYRRSPDDQAVSAPAPAGPAHELVRRGLATNLLNPKAGAFFTAVFPQFVSAHGVGAVGQVIGLALIAACASFGGQCVFAVAGHRASRMFERRTVDRAVDSAVGVVLIVLGGKLALSRHP